MIIGNLAEAIIGHATYGKKVLGFPSNGVIAQLGVASD